MPSGSYATCAECGEETRRDSRGAFGRTSNLRCAASGDGRHADVLIERIEGWTNEDFVGSRPTLTWRVTYKGHLLGCAVDELEARRWIDDMRRMEATGEYDPARSEADRLAHLAGLA